jgi:hypothetical protein
LIPTAIQTINISTETVKTADCKILFSFGNEHAIPDDMEMGWTKMCRGCDAAVQQGYVSGIPVTR